MPYAETYWAIFQPTFVQRGETLFTKEQLNDWQPMHAKWYNPSYFKKPWDVLKSCGQEDFSQSTEKPNFASITFVSYMEEARLATRSYFCFTKSLFNKIPYFIP